MRNVSVGSDEPARSYDAGPRPPVALDAGLGGAAALTDAQPNPPPAAAPDSAVSPAPDAGPPPPTPPTCTGTQADCDHDPATGCEVNLATDVNHCGKCEIACRYPDCVCRAGVLAVACPQGRADCDGDSSNGCEVNTDSSMQHCGRCNRLCHTMGHDAIAAVCVSGKCRITCETEFSGQNDCDDNPDNGCETNIWTNENCGQCGVKCTCLNGVCRR